MRLPEARPLAIVSHMLQRGHGASVAWGGGHPGPTFIVAGPLPDRVHIAPVGLGLGVLQGVAVDLARARDEEPRATALCEAQHVERPKKRRLGRLDGVPPGNHLYRNQ